jgi:putative glutamine amidotransferase
VGTCSTPQQNPRYGTNQVYVASVERAGGTALLIPPIEHGAAVGLLSRLDGLIVPGGADVHPSFYGERVHTTLEDPDQPRDTLEMTMIRAARRRRMPVFGICRGMQMVNVTLGGTLYQDIASDTESKIRHKPPRARGRAFLAHEIDIAPDSWFAETARSKHLAVNSLHHQAVRKVGRGLRVTARSADGIIEGLETPDRRIVCVQCHPEELTTVRWARDLFRAFIASCRD